MTVNSYRLLLAQKLPLKAPMPPDSALVVTGDLRLTGTTA